MFKQLILSTSIALSISTQVIASGVEYIRQSQAQGLSGTPPSVHLHKGYGDTLIDFREIEGYVRQVNIGDSSRIVMNSDDPNCLSSMAKRGNKPCEAQILYLKQIEPIRVEGLYTAPWTELKVITDNSIYVFKIVYDPNPPKNTVYKLMEDGVDNEGQPSLLDEYLVMRRGYSFGREQGYITDKIARPLKAFLEEVRGGMTVNEAAEKHSISQNAIKKLSLLGEIKSLEE